MVIMTTSFFSCNNSKSEQYVEKKITPLTNHWEVAIPNQEIPKGLSSLSAVQCGSCHQQHYQEWKLSTHANAWTDLQFQAELKKESSPFMCINCHIPLQNQQEYIIKGLINGDIYQPVKEKNPHFDKDLQQEGINCSSCHVRNNVVIGPTGTKKAPHKTVKDTKHLSEQLCISCHNAVAIITPTLACTFQTGDEWKAGPFYGKKNCISCHMEETNREIVAGYGERKSRFHYFAGSGIPKRKGLETKMLNGLEFYSPKVKANYKQNEVFNYTLKLKNENAGHKVPTGDPERFFIIQFELKDAQGEVIAANKYRIGEVWEWYPEAKKLSDNNINPGEERAFNFINELKVKGKYILTVKVTKHRMSEETAKYNKLGSDYPLFISIFEKEYKFSVN
jgi:nitrate/TMAO reductase-like tetraheme cytochrome c subunit